MLSTEDSSLICDNFISELSLLYDNHKFQNMTPTEDNSNVFNLYKNVAFLVMIATFF